ncbi:hypothetical protein PQX77_000240 [Marasmius sp. AFHP31]|nr:hypothetical protein PQX77_000240 [Marasmius sp. AFHP31]
MPVESSLAQAANVPEGVSTVPETATGVPVINPSKRIQRLDCLRAFSYTLRPTKKAKPKKTSSKKPVLTVKRHINYKGQHVGTEVEILSQALGDLLLEINNNVEELKLTEVPPKANPKVLFNSYDGLRKRLQQERIKPCRDDEFINDIEVAIQYIQEEFADVIPNLEKLLNTHQQITYRLLWAIFKPNTLVYHFHALTEQDQILLVRSLLYEQTEDGRKFAIIDCRIIHDNGVSLGYTHELLKIDEFSGAQKVLALPTYPLDYHPDKAALREHVIERGKKFVQIAKDKRCLYEISGPGMCQSVEGRHEKFTTHGRAMVDATAFRRFQPNYFYPNRKLEQREEPDLLDLFYPDRNHRKLDSSQDLTDDDFLICTPVVLGFCFGTKRWGGFAIDRLQDIEWSGEPLESLVLGEQQKTLIRALVEQHSNRSKNFDDVVKGKGRGLIGLLCGSPGCGKTLTAEALAEFTKRPLYVLSAGELGVEPHKVEECLDQVLELGRTWDAILLLDEAEVFLQQRSPTDVVRNALVSIFLRRLEYYHGILFLTTNLLEQCDAAFESRIHFTINYPDLGVEAQKKIWKTFLNRTTKEGERLSDSDIDMLARRVPMNGRQIKNAVSSAQCIALSKNAPLSVEHVITVLSVTQRWDCVLDESSNETKDKPLIEGLDDLFQ